MALPLAILCSDLHFSHNPPLARSAEPNWYLAMGRQWSQVREFSLSNDLPIVIAGDIFDHWKSSPELISFAIRMFGGLRVFAVPGQHDLPNHSYDDIYRSAYVTLVEAGVLTNIGYDRVKIDENLVVFGFPWGKPIHGPGEWQEAGVVTLAVVHRYIWAGSNCYSGAPNEMKVSVHKEQLRGYMAAVFGDNHKGFLAQAGRCVVFNCGSFMCRHNDERSYKPRYGILYDDGDIEECFFDTSKDKWADPSETLATINETLNLGNLVDGLESLGADALDFSSILRRYLDQHDVDHQVRRLVLEALNEGRGDRS